jgi:transposase
MPPKVKLSAKHRALIDSGTFNRHADTVRDPVFQDSDFFDPHDLVQVRYEMLRRVHIDGHSIAQTVAQFGLTRPTFYKLQADFHRAGLAGLLPAKRGPHGPHKLTAEIWRYVEQTRQEQPDRSTTELVALIQQQFGVQVHPRTVERALARSKKKQR